MLTFDQILKRMKNALLVFVMVFFMGACTAQPEVFFPTKMMGGQDSHGHLYRKKYPKPGDTQISYNQWKGVVVRNNEQLRQLFRSNPGCEAIKFEDWDAERDVDTYEIDPVIGKFKNLKFLEIQAYKVSYPESMGNLTGLEEMFLHTSSKREIEFSFSKLQKLRHLTIHYADDLRVFPNSVFDCQNLETLKLFRLYSLEDKTLHGIQKLENLREMFIWDSNFKLPDTTWNFRQLETLILEGYRFPVPEYFFNLKTLKRVALCTNDQELDVSQLSGMENLEALSLSYQSDLKGELDLKKLQHLDVTSFRGAPLDIGIDALPSLESLVIWDCNELTTIKNISNPGLRSITINSNDKLATIEFEPEKLKSLEEVTVKYNKILELEQEFINDVPIFRNKK